MVSWPTTKVPCVVPEPPNENARLFKSGVAERTHLGTFIGTPYLDLTNIAATLSNNVFPHLPAPILRLHPTINLHPTHRRRLHKPLASALVDRQYPFATSQRNIWSLDQQRWFFEHDPGAHFVKVSDVDSNDIVSLARWHRYAGPETANLTPDFTTNAVWSNGDAENSGPKAYLRFGKKLQTNRWWMGTETRWGGSDNTLSSL